MTCSRSLIQPHWTCSPSLGGITGLSSAMLVQKSTLFTRFHKNTENRWWFYQFFSEDVWVQSSQHSCSSCHPEFLHIFTCLNADEPVLSFRIPPLLPLWEISSPSCRVKHLPSCILASPVSLGWSGFLCRVVSSQRADKNDSTQPSLPARSSLGALHTVDTTECLMVWSVRQWSLWHC